MAPRSAVLVVEDDESFVEALDHRPQAQKAFACRIAATAREALDLLRPAGGPRRRVARPDAPEGVRYRRIAATSGRGHECRSSLVTVAKTAEIDTMWSGSRSGADDYVTKALPDRAASWLASKSGAAGRRRPAIMLRLERRRGCSGRCGDRPRAAQRVADSRQSSWACRWRSSGFSGCCSRMPVVSSLRRGR